MKNSGRGLGSHAHLHPMPDALRDWLKDYKILRPSDLPAYAKRIRQDERLADAIHSVIENALPHVEASSADYDVTGRTTTGTTDPGLLSSLCHQLFQFYRQPAHEDRLEVPPAAKSAHYGTKPGHLRHQKFTFLRARE